MDMNTINNLELLGVPVRKRGNTKTGLGLTFGRKRKRAVRKVIPHTPLLFLTICKLISNPTSVGYGSVLLYLHDIISAACCVSGSHWFSGTAALVGHCSVRWLWREFVVSGATLNHLHCIYRLSCTGASVVYTNVQLYTHIGQDMPYGWLACKPADHCVECNTRSTWPVPHNCRSAAFDLLCWHTVECILSWKEPERFDPAAELNYALHQ